jgi:hypothetical protein
VTFLVFLSKPTGYELHEHEGDPPPVGAQIEEDDVRMRVLKVAPSPLPGDPRRCAYVFPE